MNAANMKVLRVFVNGVNSGQKGSDNIAIPDLEANGFAQWDDTILNAIDTLMVRDRSDQHLLDSTYEFISVTG